MVGKARVQKRLYYKIGEACKELGIQPYVLRYWETEFPALAPSKSRSGQRVYSEKELEIIRRIKQLLYEEGYTIAGAKKKLETELARRRGLDEDRRTSRRSAPAAVAPATAAAAAEVTGRSSRPRAVAQPQGGAAGAGARASRLTRTPRNGYKRSARGSRRPSRKPARSSPSWIRSPRDSSIPVGTWRSLVAYLNGVQGVPSSNLGVPTNFLL